MATNREYAMNAIKSNNEEIENLIGMITSRLEQIEADVKRLKRYASNGDLNGIDTFCGNTSSALVQLMKDTAIVKADMATNSALEFMMDEEN